jgi:hypothetical protein
VVKRSFEVEWRQPICFLFVDGLHDYSNVSRDFHHFEHWIAPGGFVAFHDYQPDFPGVVSFVDELIAAGRYEPMQRALNLVVLRKKIALDFHESRPAELNDLNPS